MVERQLGVGVIGCGNIANKQHLPNYARNPRARIVAVADVDPERARATAERWSVDAYYVDYRDLLSRADVEAVSVTTWPGAHVEPVIAAANAGKHIMCEKPLAPTLEDADAMVAAAERAGVKFSVGYQTRFSNGWLTVKKLLDEGVIGRLQSINVVSCAPSAHYTPWFLRKAEAGGGVLMDWGSYTAYMINWLMGPVESVYGACARFREDSYAGGVLVPEADVEDTVAATLRFRSGALGTWYTTWAAVARHGYTSIDGSHGSILMRGGPGEGPSVFTSRFDEPEYLRGWRQIQISELALPELHYRKLAHLVDSVLDDTPLELTGTDGRDAIELVMAVYRSAEAGLPVSLPLERRPALTPSPAPEAAVELAVS
ncbi:MAG: Gfo/Idh/MocA family protein [Chloroflexota bacterium]